MHAGDEKIQGHSTNQRPWVGKWKRPQRKMIWRRRARGEAYKKIQIGPLSFRRLRLSFFDLPFSAKSPAERGLEPGAWEAEPSPRASQAPTPRQAPRKATAIAAPCVRPLAALIWSERYLPQVPLPFAPECTEYIPPEKTYAELCMKLWINLRPVPAGWPFDRSPRHWAPSALHFPCRKRRTPPHLLSQPLETGRGGGQKFHAYR